MRRVTVEFKGQEHAYDVGDCACSRTSVRHYSDGRCFYCTHGLNTRPERNPEESVYGG